MTFSVPVRMSATSPAEIKTLSGMLLQSVTLRRRRGFSADLKIKYVAFQLHFRNDVNFFHRENICESNL